MASPPRERPRLNLKPRDASAAAKAATDKAQSSRANPFGAAKPRESVLATRLGKDELAVLQEDLKKERINLRLKPEQVEEREQAEAGVAEIKTEIEQESDPDKKASLTAELNSRQEKLEALLENFQKLAVEQAKSGDTIRPSDRRRQLQEKMLQQGQQGGPPGQYGRGADFARGSSGGWGGGQSGAQPRDGGYGQGGGYQAGYNEGSYESSGSFGYGGGNLRMGSAVRASMVPGLPGEIQAGEAQEMVGSAAAAVTKRSLRAPTLAEVAAGAAQVASRMSIIARMQVKIASDQNRCKILR